MANVSRTTGVAFGDMWSTLNIATLWPSVWNTASQWDFPTWVYRVVKSVDVVTQYQQDFHKKTSANATSSVQETVTICVVVIGGWMFTPQVWIKILLPLNIRIISKAASLLKQQQTLQHPDFATITWTPMIGAILISHARRGRQHVQFAALQSTTSGIAQDLFELETIWILYLNAVFIRLFAVEFEEAGKDAALWEFVFRYLLCVIFNQLELIRLTLCKNKVKNVSHRFR